MNNNNCTYLSQDRIKAAFESVVKNLRTKIISKADLTVKLAKELCITKGQLKNCHLVAFLNCYMIELYWRLDRDTETFHKIELNTTANEIIKGLRIAGWSFNELKEVVTCIKKDFEGQLSSAHGDIDMVSLRSRKLNLFKEIKRGDSNGNS